MRKIILIIVAIIAFSACCNKRSTINYVWETEKMNKNLDDLKQHFRWLKSQGVDGVMYLCDINHYDSIGKIAKSYGLEFHAWIPTMLGGDKKELFENHPEVYAVSGKGVSSHSNPPFVDYYKWLCPSHDKVYEYLSDMYVKVAKMKNVDGVHLDYIRFSDVILAKALWKKYDVVMDKEYPQWDFCYCDKCTEGFKKSTGIDIKNVKDPSKIDEWKQYRYDLIKNLVSKLTEDIHHENKMITAAVFPGPSSVATKIVRQKWDDWNIDAFYPMNYNSFYEEDTDWIGEMCKEGVESIENRVPLYSGIFLPALKDVNDFRDAIRKSLDNGAKGVCLFTPAGMTKEHWKVFREEVFR